MSVIYLDTEAFSTVPITSGVHAYAEHAELLLVQHAWDDGPVHVEDVSGPGEWERYAPQLQWLIDEADEIVIHNSSFDRTVLRHCGVTIPTEKITDTMVLALMHSLPAGLDKLCEVLGVPTDKAKDKAGKKLIQLFCKEQPRNRKVQRATRETHPAEWEAFKSYGASDIEAMREVLKRIPRWNDTPSERELWLLDQKINDRGVKVDLDLARSALRAFERTSKELAQRSTTLTGGVVGSMTQRQKLLDHLSDAHDFDTPDLTKGTVTAALKRDDITDEVRELLEIRQQAAATSPAKYKVLLKSASSDGRLRGTIQFCGASRTGRDCLAEGSLVLVKRPNDTVTEKPIETVTVADLVWDGVEWVTHEGVVFSGDKEVVEHDSVVATAEHNVYLSDTEYATLGEAKARGLSLWRGNAILSID